MNVIIYLRKSTDEKKKQVLSLESQLREVKEYSGFDKLNIVRIFEEKRSAKIPHNRPDFDEMMHLIDTQPVDAILCWKVNRLSRNGEESGKLLDRIAYKGLKILVPPDYAFDQKYTTYLYGEMGSSQKFSMELSVNTQSGIKTKIEQGHSPSRALPGYRNTPEKEQGSRTYEVDNENNRFHLVRKMWDLLLSGKHNPDQIRITATEKWGLKQKNDTALSRTQVYNMFTSPIYAGFFIWKGELHQGQHKQMITIEEYELAQRILGSRGKPVFINKEFAYSRWIHCACGAFITAEERYRRRCPKCENKYNVENHYDVCPKCKIALSDTITHTVTYHCSRKIDLKCVQHSISLKNLEIQLDRIIASIHLPEDYARWALEMLKKQSEKEIESRQNITQSIHAQIVTNRKILDALTTKWSSPNNIDGSLLSDDEYKTRKNKLILEYAKLCEADKQQNEQQSKWIQVAERTFRFAVNARHWFNHGTKLQKRIIVQAIGSDPILDNGLLHINLLEPYKSVQNMAILGNEEITWFGPSVQKDKTIQKDNSSLQNPVKYPLRDSNP